MNIFTPFKHLYFLLTASLLIVVTQLQAQVVVTPAAGGSTISADLAGNATTPGFTLLNDIIIAETDVAQRRGDFTANAQQLVLSLPDGGNWIFRESGVTTTVTGDNNPKPSQNLSVGAISYTPTTITIALTVSGTNKTDILTIRGLEVKALDGANLSPAINITSTSNGAITGLNNTTNLGTLFQVGGIASKFTLAPVSSPQVAGTPFQVSIQAQDQFNNPATFNGTVNMSSNSGTVSPAVSNPFSAGALTQSFYVTQPGEVSITATSASPAMSVTSNAFTVTADPRGAADHLTFTGVPASGMQFQTLVSRFGH